MENKEAESIPADPTKSKSFDPKGSPPDEATVAVMTCAAKCTFQGLGLASANAGIIYFLTKRMVAMNPVLKRVPVALVTIPNTIVAFVAVTNLYKTKVCLPRIETMPQSEARDELINAIRNGGNVQENGLPDVTPIPEMLSPSEQVEIQPIVSTLADDNRDALSSAIQEKVIPTFDNTTHSHQANYRGTDFDFSKNKSLPPVEKKEAFVKRNQYGDIVEEA